MKKLLLIVFLVISGCASYSSTGVGIGGGGGSNGAVFGIGTGGRITF